MELTDLAIISADNYSDIKTAIEKEKESVDIDTYLKQLNPKDHAVMDKAKRPDKMKQTSNGGQEAVPVARLPLSLQKLIVSRAAVFLCARPITLKSEPTDDGQSNFLAAIQKVWDDTKIAFKSMTLAELMMGETECAELWYTVPAEPEYWEGTAAKGASYKMRVKILSYSRGDSLYPVFDQFGDMIAFGHGYKVKVGDTNQEHFDIYLAEKTLKGIKTENGWDVKSEPNPAKKIPVIYYSQPVPEWDDVQALIERKEGDLSDLGDTNQYFGSPILLVEGEIAGFADKGESGKVVKAKAGASAKYLTWDRSPESVKYLMETLERMIYTLTDTPDISIEKIKGLGQLSGIAIKMLFLAAHLKAAKKEAGVFGESVQRRINYLKAAIATFYTPFQKVIGLTISPKFEYYLPQNEQEMVELLTTAVGAGKPIMSQETAVRNNPLVSDPDAEIQKMTDEGTMGADIQTA